MNGMKKVWKILRDCVEIYIPIAAFLITFIVFLIQIIARYVFHNAVTWAYEVTVMGYLWMVVLGACYAYRDRSHVTFTLVYDRLPNKGKAILGFLGNLLIAVAFAVMFWPSCQMIADQAASVTSVFKIPLSVVYAPFIPFMIIIFCYVVYDMWIEIRVLFNIKGEEALEIMLNTTKSETQEAIEDALQDDEEEAGQEKVTAETEGNTEEKGGR